MLGSHKIGNIFYWVRDLDRTEAFWRDTVGLAVDRVPDEDGGPDFLIGHTAGGIDLLFFEGDSQPGNSPMIVFDLAEGGIDALVAGLVAGGAALVTPVSHAPGGWSSELTDPDGFVFSVYQPADKPR